MPPRAMDYEYFIFYGTELRISFKSKDMPQIPSL